MYSCCNLVIPHVINYLEIIPKYISGLLIEVAMTVSVGGSPFQVMVYQNFLSQS